MAGPAFFLPQVSEEQNSVHERLARRETFMGPQSRRLYFKLE